MTTGWNQSLGRWGESIAAEFLSGKDYTVLAKNQHLGHAEVDLIAQNELELVFVEVKTRSNTEFGFPEEAVDERKFELLVEAAQRYLIENDLELEWRVDVIAITGTPFSAQPPEILWYQNVTL